MARHRARRQSVWRPCRAQRRHGTAAAGARRRGCAGGGARRPPHIGRWCWAGAGAGAAAGAGAGAGAVAVAVAVAVGNLLLADVAPRTGARRRFAMQPFLPLLLVAAILERHVKRPNTLQRAAADRHVGSPREARGGVVGTEVQRGDRRPSRPQLCGGEPSRRGRIGPVKTSRSGCSRAAASSASSQPSQTSTSSSTNTTSSPVERSTPVLRATLRPSGRECGT